MITFTMKITPFTVITLPSDTFGTSIGKEIEFVQQNHSNYNDDDWKTKNIVHFTTNPFDIDCATDAYSSYDDIISFITATLGKLVAQTGLQCAADGILIITDIQETKEGYTVEGDFIT